MALFVSQTLQSHFESKEIEASKFWLTPIESFCHSARRKANL
jgi:hypothetical protein